MTTATSSTYPTSSSERWAALTAQLRADLLGPGVRVAFADRTAGASAPPYDLGNLADHVGDDPAAVAANRAELAGTIGVPPGQLRAMAAQHGAQVHVVTGHAAARPPEVDALVTTEPGLALLVLAADCVPVLLADAEAGVVGVVHAGWRGVRSRTGTAAVTAMRELGARNLRAVVGPAICGRCYEVEQDRYAAVVAASPASAAATPSGAPALDLPAGVAAELAGLGVQVSRWGGCTREQARWFSYRRDGVTGRHGGAVVLAAG